MRFLLLLPLLTTLSAEEQQWPTRTQSPKPILEQLPEKNGAAIWSTTHFIIACEIEISHSRLNDFAQTMESVPWLFKQLPLPLWVPPQRTKPVVRLCRDETSFVARGAPVAAAGCYHPHSGEILIRGDLLLNPPQANATRLQPAPNEDLLIHELIHLAMHQYGGRLPTWLVEGLPEYFAACHIRKGRYDFTRGVLLIRQHIEKFYPFNTPPILTIPSPTTLANTSSRQWLKNINLNAVEESYRQYASSLLLTHYYLEGGSQRRKELQNYLTQTLASDPHQLAPPLLKNPKAVGNQLKSFWKQKGLALKFTN